MIEKHETNSGKIINVEKGHDMSKKDKKSKKAREKDAFKDLPMLDLQEFDDHLQKQFDSGEIKDQEDDLVLGRVFSEALDHIQTIPARPELTRVRCTSDETTAKCPVTGQKDFYVVEIDYVPQGRLIESKSLKLFLERYQNEGISCEDLAADIAQRLTDDLSVEVSVHTIQKSRGGVVLEGFATGVVDYFVNEEDEK